MAVAPLLSGEVLTGRGGFSGVRTGNHPYPKGACPGDARLIIIGLRMHCLENVSTPGERRPATARAAGLGPGAGLLALQRQAGNRAVAGLVAGLPPAVGRRMQQAFDMDLSAVQVRPDSPSATAMGVRAYTRGNDVHVARGFFDPEGAQGQALIGHELTHVIQQRQGRVPTTAQPCGLDINDDGCLEREADEAGRRVAEGQPAGLGAAGGGPPTGPRPLQASGIELLKAKDPAPASAAALKDWATLKAAAANPSADDLHQILLTYQKLSDGWKSGMGDVQSALSNKYGNLQGVPESEIAYGDLLRARIAVNPKRGGGGVMRRSKLTAEERARTGPKERQEARRKDFKKKEKFGRPEAPKPHVVTYIRGTSATAAILTPRGPAGSDATTGAFAGFGSSVEGHLLNAHLHGPAETKNLAPFSGSLNGAHNHSVEDPLKKMIYNQNRMFSYRVTVLPGPAERDQGFYPEGIDCHIVEVDAAKSPVPGGYERHPRLLQNGSIAEQGTRRETGLPGGGPVAMTPPGGAPGGSAELARLWNALRFPWSRDFGAVMRDVKETAYAAVRAYEHHHGSIGGLGAPALGLPLTAVTFDQTKHIKDADEDTEAYGGHMLADPLTMRPPATGETGFQPDGEKWGNGAIKGHLLNHHLHGPAEPHNIAPMSSSMNQQFERDAESLVKGMVLEHGRVVRYEVTMSGEIDRFGFEDVPEQLDYVITPYRHTGGNREDPATWAPSARERVTGTLYNTEEGARVSDEWVPY